VHRLCFKALRRWPSLLLNFTIFAGGFGAPKRLRLPEVAKVIHGTQIEQVFRDAGARSYLVASPTLSVVIGMPAGWNALAARCGCDAAISRRKTTASRGIPAISAIAIERRAPPPRHQIA
jgi:hypothetical protein